MKNGERRSPDYVHVQERRPLATPVSATAWPPESQPRPDPLNLSYEFRQSPLTERRMRCNWDKSFRYSKIGVVIVRVI